MTDEVEAVIGPEAKRLLMANLDLDSSEPYEFTPITDWIAGGETYHRLLRATWAGGSSVLVLKDCVGFSGDPIGQMDEWIRRRLHIASIGVRVPRLYARHRSIIVEEHIAERLPSRDAIRSNPAIELSVARSLSALLQAGYWPTSMHDWRWRNGHPVIIDFGSDLGSTCEVSDAEGRTSKMAELINSLV